MYKLRPITKRSGDKTRRYKNLAVFNKECSKRSLKGNLCEVVKVRCLRDGGGVAVVKTTPGFSRARSGGTWRLHFADCGIMKRHLRGRVTEARTGMLNGRRRR